MCGIAAILGNGHALDARVPVVRDMMTRIAHRGPDGEGLRHLPTQAIFGHRRLAVIDLEHGAQPMVSADERYTLVFNGEIYNYRELRQSLASRGAPFTSDSDTEVLLQLLVHEGAAGVPRLNGMFAFVFHDRATNQWIAARDGFGVKPLYMTTVGDELLFASEIKALFAHPEVPRRRDERSLHQYLSFQYCLGDRTLFAGIQKVTPGHVLQGVGTTITSNVCYWDTNYQVDYRHTETYFHEQLESLLEDTIRLQMRSDVPVGAYLSGGLDSSIVSTLAARELGSPISMFHGRFAEGPQYDESAYAKSVARQVGGQYVEVVPRAEEFVAWMPGLMAALDEPLAGPGLFPQYAVSKAARDHVTVVLGGQGGDEIFGGYARYLVGYLEQALKGAIFETQEEGKHLVTLESIVPNLPLLQQYKPLLSAFWSRGLFEEMDARYFHLLDRSEGLHKVLDPALLDSLDRQQLFAEFQAVFNNPNTASYINKMTHFDQKTLLPALLQIEDRVSMSVSLESRVPLLDMRIVDLVTTMPPPMKFQGGRTKHVLKQVMGHVLPPDVLHRKDKMGFPVPLAEWMRGGPVRDFVSDVLLSQASLQRGVYTPAALQSMLDHSGVGGRQLWGALCLELWHQRYIDG